MRWPLKRHRWAAVILEILMKYLASVLVVGGLWFAAVDAAHAQRSTVNIIGNLVAPSCAVEVRSPGGSSGSVNGTVNLPSVTGADLSTAGARAGRRPWDVIVGTAAAPCSVSSVSVGFRNVGNVNAQGRLSNAAGADAATNVDVVVSNIQGGGAPRVINLASNANSQVVSMPASGIATLNYEAEYYATASATPGIVTTSVQFDINYN